MKPVLTSRIKIPLFLACLFCSVLEAFSQPRNCGCDDNPPTCDKRQYGYNRAYLQTPISTWGQNGQAADLTGTIKELREIAEGVRSKVIKEGHLGDKNSKNPPNIAAFSFIFFDADGGRSAPFYFRPDPTNENVKEPFFFFSGRREAEFRGGDNWDALPKSALSQEDTSMYEKMKNFCEKDFEVRDGVGSPQSSEMIRGNLQLTLTHYITLLMDNNARIPFFTYLNNRYKILGNNFCSKTIPCLEPFVVELKGRPTGSKKEETAFIPKELPKSDTEKGKGHKQIMYFTHSEQYALFKMGVKNHEGLKNFVNCVRGALGNEFQVKKYALVMYTSRVMCVRCAHSIVLDFEDKGNKEGNHTIIKETLGLDDLQRVYIAGFQELYTSNLHNQEKDAFEDLMYRQFPIDPKNKLVPKNNNGTYGYETIDYDKQVNDPLPLIYHYFISLNEGLRQAVSYEDMGKIRYLLSLSPNLIDADKNLWTVLHIAAQRHNAALHRLLIEHLKRIKGHENWHNAFLVKNNYDDTALHVGAFCNNFTFIETLANAGFPLWIMNGCRGNGGNTIVHTAAGAGHKDMVLRLIDFFRTRNYHFDANSVTTAGKKYHDLYPEGINQ